MIRMTTKPMVMAFLLVLTLGLALGCEGSADNSNSAGLKVEPDQTAVSGSDNAVSSARTAELPAATNLKTVVLGDTEAAKFSFIDPDSDLGDLEERAESRVPAERAPQPQADAPDTQDTCGNPNGSHPPTARDENEERRSSTYRAAPSDKDSLRDRVRSDRGHTEGSFDSDRWDIQQAQAGFLQEVAELAEILEEDELQALYSTLKVDWMGSQFAR